MPLQLSGTADLPRRLKRGLTRRLRSTGLRFRMLMLIAVTAIPALSLLAYHEWGVNALTAIVAPEWHDLFAVTGGLLLIGGALISIGFGIVVGEHFLRRPTEALMEAAEKWTGGDLAARIDTTDAEGTEFGRIGTAFNRLADSLGRRHEELHALNAELEARVAERTDALSHANIRLRAEMAERERVEASLRQAQKLQAIGHLAGRFAHDFNNVLTAIVAALDVLRGRTARNNDAALRLIDNALGAGERGRKLTSQLLSFSGRQRLNPIAIDLNDTVAALVDVFAHNFGPGINVETTFAADLWQAQVDPSQVEAAILNLAVNARDAMSEGGRLRLTTRNHTSDGQDGKPSRDYVAIEVSDTGIGMTDEVARMAFEPFFTTKTDSRNSGLGLSQVHGLAMHSGGGVTIRSTPDVGTTVTLLLPRAAATEATVAAPRTEAPEAASDPRYRTRLQVIRGGIADSG